MTKPICRAQSDVTESNLQRVQKEANETFTQARPVLDREMLTSAEWADRQKLLAKIVGSRDIDSNGLAHWIMRGMNTAGMNQWRTHTNIHRFIRSHRVENGGLEKLFKLSLDSRNLQPFRDGVKQMLLGAELLYYEYIPRQGTAWCYFPLNK